MIDVKTLTISQAAELLKNGTLSSTELCSKYLSRIDEIEDKIKAFVHLDRDFILQQAEKSDERRSVNSILSEYDGIPIAVKDLISVKGEPCTCGSKILKGMISPYDATVVSKLKQNGFILFGRTNMDEFAMGSTCENSSYYPTKNPWDLERVPGGSSGGSAAAVAASEVIASLCSDTGGSVRQPAAFCGVVGLKPTYGAVSRFGLTAYASSLDQIGPIAKDVLDTAILYDVITGRDCKDSTSLESPKVSYAEVVRNAPRDLKGLRVGIPKEYFAEGLSDDVRNDAMKVIALLKLIGAEIVDISLPYSKYAIASYYIIATAEASANLARFDGIRYGYRSKNSDTLNELYMNSRGEGFGSEVKRRILLGTYVLSSGYYDAYYLKAQKVRTLIQKDFHNAFSRCDVILSPTSPCPPFKVGEIKDPLQMYLADIYTISINLAGICAISVPSSLTPDTKLPMGVQFIGPARGESMILRTAKVFESNRVDNRFFPNI